MDASACASLLHSRAAVQEASTIAITRCLVDMVKQADAELEDPEEVLLGAARQARLLQFRRAEGQPVLGVSDSAAAAGSGAAGSRRQQTLLHQQQAQAQAGDGLERAGSSSPSVAAADGGARKALRGSDARSSRGAGDAGDAGAGAGGEQGEGRRREAAAAQPRRRDPGGSQQQQEGALAHGSGGSRGSGKCRSGASAAGVAASSPLAASGWSGHGGGNADGHGFMSLQDCFVFYVSVASLSAFFTRSICSYIVGWW